MEKFESAGSPSFGILYGNGSIGNLAEAMIERIGADCRVCVVCDPAIADNCEVDIPELLRNAGYRVIEYVLPEEPEGDDRASYTALMRFLYASGITVRDAVVAFGGSFAIRVVSFAAGTYLGGVRSVLIPTSLRAMVRTASEPPALCLPGTGARAQIDHSPELVVCDPDFLQSLSQSGLRSGYAEMIRYSILGFDDVTRAFPKMPNGFPTQAGVDVSIPEDTLLKASVRAAFSVPKDAAEQRSLLLFGEDIASAIRVCSEESVEHGCALAIGMSIAAKMSVSAGQCNERRYRYLISRLISCGLPFGTSIPAEKILSALPGGASSNEITAVFVRDMGCASVSLSGSEYAGHLYAALRDMKTVRAVPLGDSTVTLPYSKEMLLRVAFAWFLDDFTLLDLSSVPGDDVKHMQGCLATLRGGAKDVLDCGSSGTVLKLLLPLAGVLDVDVIRFHRDTNPAVRQNRELFELLRRHGLTIEISNDGADIVVSGQLTPGEYHVLGLSGASIVSGLLFSLPLLPEDSEINVEGELRQKHLVDLTIAVLNQVGIEIEETDTGYHIPGGQSYDRMRLQQLPLEKDWSIASVFLTLSYITGEPIRMEELTLPSLQGESIITECLSAFREASVTGDDVDIDLSDTPHLIPCVALAASLTDGVTTVLRGIDVAPEDSGNRMQQVASALRILGADITIEKIEDDPETEEDETEYFYTIHGMACLTGGCVDAGGDHSIAMMAAIAAWGCEQPVTIVGADATQRVFPEFFTEIERLSDTGRGNKR